MTRTLVALVTTESSTSAPLPAAQPASAGRPSRFAGYLLNPRYLGPPPDSLVDAHMEAKIAWHKDTSEPGTWAAYLAHIGYLLKAPEPASPVGDNSPRAPPVA